MVHVDMGQLCFHEAPRYRSNIRQSLLQRHTLITERAGVNIAVSLHSGKVIASTDQSKLEKDKANSKSTASHVGSPIMHFGVSSLFWLSALWTHGFKSCVSSSNERSPFSLYSLSSSKVLALCSRTQTYTYKLLVHFFFWVCRKVEMHTRLGS